MASGVSSTVEAAANDLGSTVEAVTGDNSSTPQTEGNNPSPPTPASSYSPSGDSDVYHALRFDRPDYSFSDDIAISGLVDIYGRNNAIVDEHGKILSWDDPRHLALARHLANFYFNVFMKSPEGKEFVKEFGYPDFRRFGVADLGYNTGAVTIPELNAVLFNSRLYHSTFVDPSGYFTALRLIAHEALHMLGDHDEYSTYARNAEQLGKRAKEAKKRGDSARSKSLDAMAKKEKELGEKNTTPGHGYISPQKYRSLEQLVEAA